MEIKHLETFVAVVESRGFAKAARRLYVSQSTVSQHIRTIESELGFDLFFHGQKKYQMTDAGKAFYAKANEILAFYNTALDDVRDVVEKESRSGRLIVAVHYELYTHISTKLSKVYRGKRPNVLISYLNCGSTEEALRCVRSQIADAAFCIECAHVNDKEMTFWHLRDVGESCIVEDDSRFASEPFVTVADLAEAPVGFFYPKDSFSFEDELRKTIVRESPSAQIFDCSNFNSLFLGVADNEHFLLAPELFTGGKMTTRVEIPLQTDLRMRFGIVTRKDCSRRVAGFAECLCDHYSKHPQEPIY